jgi:hypothetical protein
MTREEHADTIDGIIETLNKPDLDRTQFSEVIDKLTELRLTVEEEGVS